MAGSLIDLSQLGVSLPAQLAFDTNVIVSRFIPPRRVTPEHSQRRARVKALLSAMRSQHAVGFVTPTAFLEVVHIAIKGKYIRDLPTFAHVIGGKKSWDLLFKARPDLLGGYVRSIERLTTLMTLANIAVLQPQTVWASPASQRFEEAVVQSLRSYHLDSFDAEILLEARLAGIDAIVTEDPDLRRAANEFDVYTWL
jgi:predicted nucleic acid-binding protein